MERLLLIFHNYLIRTSWFKLMIRFSVIFFTLNILFALVYFFQDLWVKYSVNYNIIFFQDFFLSLNSFIPGLADKNIVSARRVVYIEGMIGSIYTGIFLSGIYLKWALRKNKRKYYYDDFVLERSDILKDLIYTSDIINTFIYPYYNIQLYIEKKRSSNPVYNIGKLIKPFSNVTDQVKVLALDGKDTVKCRKVLMVLTRFEYTFNGVKKIKIISNIISAN
jgi:hypothetical protein